MAVIEGTLALYDKAGHRSNPANYPFDFLPAVRKARVGATAGGNAAFDALNAQFPANGKLQSERIYETNIPATYVGSRCSVAAAAGRVAWFSCKPTVAAVANGSLDAQITTWLNTVPAAGPDLFVTFWHEPEDNINAGSFTLPQYKAAMNKLAALVKAQNKARLKFYMALMGPWTFWPTSPYAPWDWNGGFNWADIHYVSADPYYDLLGNRQTADSMPAFMAWARSHGCEVALAEWGCPDGPAKAPYITATQAWADAQPDVIDILYFSYNGANQWTYALSGASLDALKNAAVAARL